MKRPSSFAKCNESRTRRFRATRTRLTRPAPKNDPGHRHEKRSLGRKAEANRRLLARGELSFGRADLSPRQSPFERAAGAPAHQAAPVGALGNHAGSKFYLRAPQPHHSGLRSEYDLHFRSRAWRAGGRGQYVSGGDVLRILLAHHPRRARTETVFHA